MQPDSAMGEWRRHWPLVGATTAGMAVASMMTAAFGVMVAPMEQELGWSRAEISSGPAAVSIIGLFLATPAGYLIDRLGSRIVGIGVILLSLASACAMLLVGTQLWHWIAAWALFAVAGSFTSTVWLAPVSRIFRRGRGMAIAITVAGTGLSSAFIPAFAESVLQDWGWREAFAAVGVVWCGIAMLLTLLFVPRQAAETSGEATGSQSSQTMAGLAVGEGFRSRKFWLLYFASLASTAFGVAIVMNLIPVLTDSGLTRESAIWLAGLMGVCSITGRLVGGWLMDNFDVRWLAVIASLISVIFPVALLVAPGAFWAGLVGLIAYGLTGGMKMNAIVYLVGTHLGQRHFGVFYGAISTSATLAVGFAPLAANHVFDLTQSYGLVIAAAIPGFLLSALLFYALGPAPREFVGPSGDARKAA